jgi:hypothetical protein
MYDSDQTTVTNALKNANPTVFSDQTIQNILNLTTTKDNTTVRFDTGIPDQNGNVTVPSGAEVVFVNSSNTFQTTVKPPANAPVIIFQGKGGVVATINDLAATVPSSDQTKVERVVVGSAGDDKIVVQDAKNTNIILGSGNSSVIVGGGVNTIQAGLGNSSIVGGNGDYAVVKLAGNASNYNVTSQNGHAIVTNNTTNKVTDISKIQYVQLDNGNALVFARNSVEGQVASLYRVAFGRDADVGGLDYWFDLAKGGATLKQIATSFVNSAEFAALPSRTDLQFIQALYQNAFNRAGEDTGVAYWLNDLNKGASRAEVIASFAQIAVQNIQGTAQVPEVQVVGSVSIIDGIV